MFQVGDLAYYPSQGIGRIEEVISYEIDDTVQQFYVVRILENGVTIKVPVARAEKVGMRAIIPQEDVPRIFEILRSESKIGSYRTWNKRFRDYHQKLKSGSPFEVAEVLRDLMILSRSKDLAFSERRMLEQAKSLLIKELSFALNSDEDALLSEVTSVVAPDLQEEDN